MPVPSLLIRRSHLVHKPFSELPLGNLFAFKLGDNYPQAVGADYENHVVMNDGEHSFTVRLRGPTRVLAESVHTC